MVPGSVMKFHHVHGTAVILTENKTVATRSEGSFYNGITFSEQPVKVNQKVSVEIASCDKWSGGIRIGFTLLDPGKAQGKDLPKYSIPSLSLRDGYWIQPIPENILGKSCRLSVYFGAQGHLQIFVNNVHRGTCPLHIPKEKTLWFILDLYGNSYSARFVKPDEAPKEILSRGPDAIRAYEEACTSGTQPIYRTRLMLLGQEGVGKTSLKKALTGQKYDTQEESTESEGIDLSASFSFSAGDSKLWQAAVRGDFEKESDNTQERRKLGIIGGKEGIEEEYHLALAKNIVKELHNNSTTQKKGKDSISFFKSKPGSRDSNRSTFSRKSDKNQDKTHFIPPELVPEVPDRVVDLVQEILEGQDASVIQNKTEIAAAEDAPSTEQKVVTLNIWDFAGQQQFYATHQVFLTSRAVYIFVFNLCHDLKNSPVTEMSSMSDKSEALNTLEYMDFWMRSIYAHLSQNTSNTIDNTRLSPPILIVGTHQDDLSPDPIIRAQKVDEKFEEVQNFLVDKPYAQHIVTPFVAVENSMGTVKNDQVDTLRDLIQDIASKEPYMGEQHPIHWLRFEQEILKLVNRDLTHASFDQIVEIANNLGITSPQEVKTMLEFYHDLGILIYYGGSGTVDNLLRNIVILNPQWLIGVFTKVIQAKQKQDKWSMLKEKWRMFDEKGLLESSLLDHLWADVVAQKPLLLGMMDKMDLICCSQQCQQVTQPLSYYVPLHLPVETNVNKRLYAISKKDVVFYIDFMNFLPDGLFQKLLTKAVKWCVGTTGKPPYSMLRHVARFYLDEEHDFALHMAPRKFNRIKVVIMRVANAEEEFKSNDGNKDVAPRPETCAKLRNFLELSLYDIKEQWIKRLSYSITVRCPCWRPCYLHDAGGCLEEDCVHFLQLDECLAHRIVCCEHRRIKTALFRSWFPEPMSQEFIGHILPHIDLMETNGNIEKHNQELPMWIKSAAKLLNGGEESQDWLALAHLMGYKEKQIDLFLEDLNPALALLTDWILTSGNTVLSVDLLLKYLDQMKRYDIMDIIQTAKECNPNPAPVFISYQWDSQDEVRALRNKLEKSGFNCWMDIGQMGGGDQLNSKIDEGIRNAKAVISCITPKYVVSQHCNREISLADLLSKPIIPVMFEPTPWPPPGGMSLIFAQLVYINMKGVGGHGGTGIHSDLRDKYKEIIQKVMNFASPDLTKYFESETDDTSSEQNGHNVTSSLSSFDSLETVVQNANIANVTPRSRATHRSSRQPSQARTYNRHAMQQPFPPQQVTVTRCGACHIL